MNGRSSRANAFTWRTCDTQSNRVGLAILPQLGTRPDLPLYLTCCCGRSTTLCHRKPMRWRKSVKI